jgi:hypothetical protein
MPLLGTALCGASVGWLAWNYWRTNRGTRRQRPPALWGLLGLLLIALAAALAALRVGAVLLYLTPLFWTGYILAIDGAVWSVRGRSLVASEPRAFAWMALLSIPLWLIFEAYNLRLRNWQYVGLPRNAAPRLLGYLWSFATIWPAVLETADFLLATQFRERPARPLALPPRPLILVGLFLLILPLVLPAAAGSYLFGSVWLGFAFLLDPLNYQARGSSILGDFSRGSRRRLWALLAAGGVCGFLWEFCNYWATAKWIYIFPIGQGAKIFEMPAAGFLGFPAFAVEVFSLYVYVTGRLRVPYYEVG